MPSLPKTGHAQRFPCRATAHEKPATVDDRAGLPWAYHPETVTGRQCSFPVRQRRPPDRVPYVAVTGTARRFPTYSAAINPDRSTCTPATAHRARAVATYSGSISIPITSSHPARSALDVPRGPDIEPELGDGLAMLADKAEDGERVMELTDVGRAALARHRGEAPWPRSLPSNPASASQRWRTCCRALGGTSTAFFKLALRRTMS